MTDWLPPEAWAALLLSLRVSAVATAVSLPFALACALALARGRFAGRGLLDGLVHLPLILPPVVTGYLLLLAFGRRGPIGHWLESTLGVTLAFRWTGAALAAGIMGFPLMVRAIRLAIEAVDPRLEAAAATLGAPRLAVLATVTFPLILPGVLAGAVLAFAKAMGEFGATITFVSAIPGQTQTLPAAIYAALQVPGAEGTVARMAAVSVVVALAAVAVADRLSRAVAQRIAGG